jgi:hypothetical protein
MGLSLTTVPHFTFPRPNNLSYRRKMFPTSLPSHQSPIETFINQLLSPQVSDEEASEYDSYVHQFAVLSLSLTDLTAKDTEMYRSTVRVANGGGVEENEGGKGSLCVDKNSMNIYREAVKVSSSI